MQPEAVLLIVGVVFGTAVIIYPDGFTIDVASARMEYYKFPAALPVVELSSIKLDLYRRDFTINTLAVQLNPERFGVLIDFFNAQKDIKEKAIRVLHNLSFVEGPEVDDVVCLAQPEPFGAIGYFYLDFHQLADDEVIGLMRQAPRAVTEEHPGAS